MACLVLTKQKWDFVTAYEIKILLSNTCIYHKYLFYDNTRFNHTIYMYKSCLNFEILNGIKKKCRQTKDIYATKITTWIICCLFKILKNLWCSQIKVKLHCWKTLHTFRLHVAFKKIPSENLKLLIIQGKLHNQWRIHDTSIKNCDTSDKHYHSGKKVVLLRKTYDIFRENLW